MNGTTHSTLRGHDKQNADTSSSKLYCDDNSNTNGVPHIMPELTQQMVEQLMFSKLNMIIKRDFYQPKTIQRLRQELKELTSLYGGFLNDSP